MESAGVLREFPPVVLGACHSATNVEQAVEKLGRIYDGETLKEVQERHFVIDGKSAERVTQAIQRRF